MALERKDVRAKLDADMHEALKAVCETENLDMGEFIERELVRVIKQRVHAAHDIAARTRRPGTSGKTKE